MGGGAAGAGAGAAGGLSSTVGRRSNADTSPPHGAQGEVGTDAAGAADEPGVLREGHRALRAQVAMSRQRVRGCRAGASFSAISRKLELAEAREEARRAARPQWRPVRFDTRLALPKLAGKAGAQGGTPRAAARTAPSAQGRHAPQANARGDAHARESHVVGAPPPAATNIRMDPAAAITDRLYEWERACAEQDMRLGAALAKCKAERVATYKRKFKSFAVRGTAGFDAQRWRLEAERHRIEAQLVAVDRHKWYSRLLASAPTAAAAISAGDARGHRRPHGAFSNALATAVGAAPRQGAAAPSGEVKILLAVRSCIESGGEFGLAELVALAGTITRDELDFAGVQKLLIIIKDELGLPMDVFLRAFTQHNLPVPYLLKREQAGLGVGKESARRNSNDSGTAAAKVKAARTALAARSALAAGAAAGQVHTPEHMRALPTTGAGTQRDGVAAAKEATDAASAAGAAKTGGTALASIADGGSAIGPPDSAAGTESGTAADNSGAFPAHAGAVAPLSVPAMA